MIEFKKMVFDELLMSLNYVNYNVFVTNVLINRE